jgi:hypothetical protein
VVVAGGAGVGTGVGAGVGVGGAGVGAGVRQAPTVKVSPLCTSLVMSLATLQYVSSILYGCTIPVNVYDFDGCRWSA